MNRITVLLVSDPGSEKSAVVESLIRSQVSLELISTLSDDEACNKVEGIAPGLVLSAALDRLSGIKQK